MQMPLISELDQFLVPWVSVLRVIVSFQNLISTMPLSTLLDLTGRSDAADRLLHSSLHLVCLGLRGKPEDLFGKNGCIYYPEVGTIFHKACVFSNVDPDSVPDKVIFQKNGFQKRVEAFLPRKLLYVIIRNLFAFSMNFN